ncbi:phospholipase [Halobacteriales archaeon SW_7_68_16]|nr:MAG: phospholipase [Halobacteriales archaeon SW_7_68_16]
MTLTDRPDALSGKSPGAVVAVSLPALANTGERLELRRNGTAVDIVAYRDAPEGERYAPATGEWVPIGATDHRPVAVGNASTRLFVLPDTPATVRETIADADRRLYLAGYTFTSGPITDRLLAAHARGVDVRVVVDAAPVGGFPQVGARRLDRLAAAGVDVRVAGARRGRYDYYHAKYAVVDDRVLVTTENWKPSGVGGHGNRGWGAVVRNRTLAVDLAELFDADATARDAIPWERFRRDVDPVPGSRATGRYPRRFDPRSVRADAVRVLVAPDDAEPALVDLLADADRSIRVQQASIDPTGPLANATLAAARRGVAVRVLLSGAWYAREENRRVVARLRRIAARENLDLSARVSDPNGRFAAIHAKGVIVDDRHVVVGSINWNPHALRANREVTLVVSDPAAAAYYGRVFAADWRGGWRRVSALTVVALVVVVTVALRVASRRITFDGERDAGGPDGA